MLFEKWWKTNGIELATVEEKAAALKGWNAAIESQVRKAKLIDLKSRPCSLEELQATLIHLIELYNEQGRKMNDAINRKQDKEWRATI